MAQSAQELRAKLESQTLTQGRELGLRAKLSAKAKSMTGDTAFSPNDGAMSPSVNLDITVSQNYVVSLFL